MLDEKAPVALYSQLKENLVEKIKKNEWSINTKIPTERQLCDIYNVSRITVRQALDELEKEGYLYRKQGKGTFITAPKIEQRLSNFYSFSEEIKKMGYYPSTRVLDFQVVACVEEISNFLNVRPGTETYEIKRLRLANGEPFALETSYVPYDICSGLTVKEVSEYGLYNSMKMRCNIIPVEAEETFEAIIISGDNASLLNTGKNSPGIYLERLTSSDARVIEFCKSIIRGDRYKYKVILK